MTTTAISVADRYDRALRYARHYRFLPGVPTPKPTAAWPQENIVLLERFRDWLSGSGTRQDAIDVLYIPMAGHALGLNLVPHPQIDLDADLERALDYIRAKRLSAEWTHMCQCALGKFRLFLRQHRGCADPTLTPPDRDALLSRYCTGLPGWLVEHLERYLHLAQRNWRPARLNQRITRFWGTHTRLWRWLFERYPIASPADVKRQHIFDYIDHRLADGVMASTVNQELRALQAFLHYLQERDIQIPMALLRIPGLKQPDRLPRFLTDEQVCRLRDEIERRVQQARTSPSRRNALLDRAAFYLLWQGGLRVGEVEELSREDLDLPGHRLVVRQGKGRKDRTVYLTDTVVRALEAYLDVRGMGPSDHVFLYRNRPLRKDLIPVRIRTTGARVGVKATPHRLRHTYATQLVNAGCRVTSIQKLLGHRSLSSTMIYARVHNRTVAEDYYAAMARIEKQLDPNADHDPVTRANNTGGPEGPGERARLRALLDRLAEPQLGLDARLELVEQMRRVLSHTENLTATDDLHQKTMDTAA